MSEEQLKELQEYNLEYLEAQSSEEIFGGDYTSAVELKYAKREIERLTKQNKALNGMYELTKKEYIRLNNIINELEKYCNEEIEDYDKNIKSQYITDIAKEQYEGEKVCFEDMLYKIKELKGSESNE